MPAPTAAIESHPQRVEIINALLAGESARAIVGWVDPKLSHSTISRYKRLKIKPAMFARANSNALKNVAPETVARVKADTVNTRLALDADLFTQRLAKKYERYDRWIEGAEKKEDFRSLASLDQAETRTMHFQAELEGRLDKVTTQTVNATVIVLPQPIASAQMRPALDAGDAIDITPG